MDVSRFVGGMVARAGTPGRVSTERSRMMMMAVILVRSRSRVVQQVRDGGLATTAGRIPDCPHFRHMVIVVEDGVRPQPAARSSLVLVLLSGGLPLSRHRLGRRRPGLRRSTRGFEARGRRPGLVRRGVVRCCWQGLAQSRVRRTHGRMPGPWRVSLCLDGGREMNGGTISANPSINGEEPQRSPCHRRGHGPRSPAVSEGHRVLARERISEKQRCTRPQHNALEELMIVQRKDVMSSKRGPNLGRTPGLVDR